MRRLHRLHIRVDAARAGLDAALARAVGGGAAAGVPAPARGGGAPRDASRTAGAVPMRACSDGRSVDPEAAANALGRALAAASTGPPCRADVRAALADAEQLLVLARRVHNDAVRDTLGLRSRRLVRWLRLAGTAPMPAYFEIADPAPTLTYDRVSPSQE